jgi:hypothetical protein
MKGRKLVLLGLAAVVAVGCLFVAACGGDGDEGGPDPKAAMQQALDVVEAHMSSLMGSVTSGAATGADLKVAIEQYTPDYQAIVDACAGVEGADAAKAQQLWDDLEAAVLALPDDAGQMQMAGLAGPGIALQNYVSQLRDLVGPSPTT